MTSYRTVEEISSDDEREVPAGVMNADTEARSTTQRERCLDFWCCRRNSAAMLVVLDVLFLVATLWNYGDMIGGMLGAGVLGRGGDWWFYLVLCLPVLLQLYGIALRLRYALSSEAAHADIDWQLRHVARPFVLSMFNSLAAEVYLFLLPLYAPVLLGAPLTFGAFGALWARAFTQPSNIAFTILFLLLLVCNWRVASKHRWRVKTYIAALQARAARNIELHPVSYTPQSLTPRAGPPMRAAPLPVMRPPSGAANSSTGELRVVQAQQIFVAEHDYNNDKPTSDDARRRPKSARKQKSSSRRRALTRAHPNTSSAHSQPSLDASVRSGEDVAGERW
jgi:hypothetical protein